MSSPPPPVPPSPLPSPSTVDWESKYTSLKSKSVAFAQSTSAHRQQLEGEIKSIKSKTREFVLEQKGRREELEGLLRGKEEELERMRGEGERERDTKEKEGGGGTISNDAKALQGEGWPGVSAKCWSRQRQQQYHPPL